MVAIHKEKDSIRIEVLDWHKWMALRGELRIARKNIKKVSRGGKELWNTWGWRLPGTYIPYWVKAGSYYHQGAWEFWDMSNAENTLIIELQDEAFAKLFVEVEDPVEAIQVLST